MTVENNIAIMKADQNPLTTLEALYVGGSRHKNNLAIVTNDKDRLLRIISEKLDIASEKIEFKEPRQMRVVDPQTIIEKEQSITPQEPEKPQERENSRKIDRPQDTQKTSRADTRQDSKTTRPRGPWAINKFKLGHSAERL